MAPYAAQVWPDDRWRAIHYMRTLQGVALPTASTRTSSAAPATDVAEPTSTSSAAGSHP